MRRASAGFTLIEVLVALAVLGTVLATVLGMVSGQLRRIARGDEQVTLALFADNLLARADVDLGAGPTASGELADGLRWTIERTPYLLPPLPARRDGTAGTDDRPQSLLDGALGGAPSGTGETGSSEGPGEERRQSALDQRSDNASTGSPGSESTRRQPPPQLWLIRVQVENARGERFQATTLRLEAARPGAAS